jgi:hypothetical protein
MPGFTVYFATDLHGSEQCFRKFLNAGKFYGVDAVILGGDVAGKALIPVVSGPAAASMPMPTASRTAPRARTGWPAWRPGSARWGDPGRVGRAGRVGGDGRGAGRHRYPPVMPERASAIDIARSRMPTARSISSFSITSAGMSWNRL